MTLRRRVGTAAAMAVAVAVVLVAAISYFVVRRELLGQVDSALQQQAADVNQLRGCREPAAPARYGGSAPIWQVTLGSGQVICGGELPSGPRVQTVASSGTGEFFTNVTVGGAPFRELTVGIQAGSPFQGFQPAALQLARPLGPTENVLSRLRLILALLCLGGIALAVVLGRLAASRVLAPLADVAATAEHIGETEDLTSRIHVQTDDEVGQLATRFNTMLERLQASRDALDESVHAQRQLVADASHELRTPVTSLRTNIELLLEHDHLDPGERRRMLADVVEQTEELSALVGDLIELARGDLPPDSIEDVRLDQVASEAVRRAQRNFPQIRFEQTLSPVLVEGMPDRLSRAINNLLDNAARHSPPEGVVEVSVEGDAVRVRDHGPGVAAADMPYVFDRFYRGVGSRGKHGSGLGLAIVRQVAQQHGGSVNAENAPDGGAVFSLRLPAAPQDAPVGSTERDGAQEASSYDSGGGWLGDPSLAGDPEALAQQPEADDEHRDYDEQQEPATQRAAE